MAGIIKLSSFKYNKLDGYGNSGLVEADQWVKQVKQLK